MPSQLHESHLFLFQNQPSLAAELMRDALGVKLPRYRQARLASADLTDIQPAEYRADMVVRLCDDDAAVYAIILEVQLSEDKRKRFVWPAYVANLRARLECPVSLLVVTPHEKVARWAARRVEIGGLHQFTPYVLGPSGVPVVTDERVAQRNPELAVLSAMAHGRDSDVTRAIEIAVAAQGAVNGLDSDRSRIYLDLIMNSVGEAARRALNAMDPRKYVFQSDFARHYIALGKAEGIEEGRAEGRTAGRIEALANLVCRLLVRRFGTLDPEVQETVQRATLAELEAIADRVLTARSLEEALALS